MMKFQPGWTQTDNQDFDRQVTEIVKRVLPTYLKSQAFTDRKLTDTPTDGLQVVNRNYTNFNGLLANRPSSSIATMGQKYFATDTNMFMIFNSTTLKWYNGVASIVAN